MPKTQSRAWMDYKHLGSLATSDAGSIWMQPTCDHHIYFDAAKSNHLPANLPDGDYGSTVLNIGGFVLVRASGHVTRDDENGWTIDPQYFSVTAYRGGSVTPPRERRARELCLSMALGWISGHADELAEAEVIARNNAAHTLEENIARHAEALKILRRELRACESGRPFTQYPGLPTKGR